MFLNPIINIDISASSIAWYGAIVATVSVIISSLNFLRDKPRIKIKLSQGFLDYGGRLSNHDQILIEAINFGRRPVTLTGAGFYLNNGKNIVIFRSEMLRFPYELQENKSTQIEIDRVDALKQAKNANAKILYAWYKDATGKIYKTRFTIKQ